MLLRYGGVVGYVRGDVLYLCKALIFAHRNERADAGLLSVHGGELYRECFRLHLYHVGYMMLRAGGGAGVAHHLHCDAAHDERIGHIGVGALLAAGNAGDALHDCVGGILHYTINFFTKQLISEDVRHFPVGKGGVFSHNVSHAAAHELHGSVLDDLRVCQHYLRRDGGQRLFEAVPRHCSDGAAEAVHARACRAGDKAYAALVRAEARDVVNGAAADGDNYFHIALKLREHLRRGYLVRVQPSRVKHDLLLGARMPVRRGGIGVFAVERTALTRDTELRHVLLKLKKAARLYHRGAGLHGMHASACAFSGVLAAIYKHLSTLLFTETLSYSHQSGCNHPRG